MTRKFKLWPRLKGAAGPSTDQEGYDKEPDAGLMLPAVPEVKLPHSFDVFQPSSWFQSTRILFTY